jgi:hydrogenase/urease accessory protein HupE
VRSGNLPTNLFNKSSGDVLGFIEIMCFLNHLLVVVAIGRWVEVNLRSRWSVLGVVVCM